MPATKRLVLDLPADRVDEIEARVAAGEFASPSALVLARLQDEHLADDPWLQSDAGRRWLAEGEEVMRRLDARLESTTPMDEVFDRLHARLDARIAEEDGAAGEHTRA